MVGKGGRGERGEEESWDFRLRRTFGEPSADSSQALPEFYLRLLDVKVLATARGAQVWAGPCLDS